MNLEFFAAIFRVDEGWMGILVSEKGLCRVFLPGRTERAVRAVLLKGCQGSPINFKPPEKLVKPFINDFSGYFSGSVKRFSLPLDFCGATDFERAVWKVTRAIPYGETRTYGWVAKMLRRPNAVRAVGGALGRNPLPIIIPCHRVVGTDGSLGGFSGGLAWKRRLLALEKQHSGKS
jgi:O-6-methylguanine DNA methyltransferase